MFQKNKPCLMVIKYLIIQIKRRQKMFLPKLSNQEIGCYHSKSLDNQADANHSNSSNTKPGPAGVEDIGHELAELKKRHDYLRQTLHQLGTQLLNLA
jgi:hypothetical protein